MGAPELEKLRQEFRRFNSEDFLDAIVAVCVLTAAADGDVASEELYSIDN
ncbi:MAG: tellurite resistance TerB family protein [Alphaproteobacteria bacterium]|nr:tellurite resistance TerB family protein [Alphaproteobacteria bacterium]